MKLKLQHTVLSIIAFICMLGICLADEPQKAKLAQPAAPSAPERVALTDAEQKQLAPVAQGFLDTRSAYQKALGDAQSVDVGDCAKVTAAVAKLQLALERFMNADAALTNIQDRFAEAHKCEGCKLHNDLKSLVKPPAAPKP
ncbi:MAG: hypothetical protein HY231_23930 [Acidobacteria bacterium]|nr:hypothetical protein [Acidobacteriota bacterium]